MMRASSIGSRRLCRQSTSERVRVGAVVEAGFRRGFLSQYSALALVKWRFGCAWLLFFSSQGLKRKSMARSASGF